MNARHWNTIRCVESHTARLTQRHGGDVGGKVISSWQPKGNFLATAGKNGIVHIWDRHGERVPDGEIRPRGPGAILALEWDNAGELLAVLQEGNGKPPAPQSQPANPPRSRTLGLT